MPGSLSDTAFRDAMAYFASGVTVITACSERGPVGVTASAFTSVSCAPPLVLVCLARGASVQRAVLAADLFGVSILAERQEWIAEQFARSGVDRFLAVPVQLSTDSGLPLVEGALVHLECRRHATHEGGDHDIFVGEVRAGTVRPGGPLIHYGRRFGGFAPGPDSRAKRISTIECAEGEKA